MIFAQGQRGTQQSGARLTEVNGRSLGSSGLAYVTFDYWGM